MAGPSCLGIWSNIIQDVSMTVFFMDEINTEIDGLWVKPLHDVMVGWASYNQWKPFIEQSLTSPEQEGTLPANFLWMRTTIPLGLQAASLHNLMSQFLKISLSPSICPVSFISLKNHDSYLPGNILGNRLSQRGLRGGKKGRGWGEKTKLWIKKLSVSNSLYDILNSF